MLNKKGPMWIKYGSKLARLFCDHSGHHGEWGYLEGRGIVQQLCSKCGKPIQKVYFDDLPKDTLEQIVRLLREQREEEDQADD